MSASESPLATTTTPSERAARRLRNYVGGEWVEPSCEWLNDTNPATGELVGLVPCQLPATWTQRSRPPAPLSPHGGRSRRSVGRVR